MKLPKLEFDHGFSEEQLQWHWEKFLEEFPVMLLTHIGDNEAGGLWRAYLHGAASEVGRVNADAVDATMEAMSRTKKK